MMSPLWAIVLGGSLCALLDGICVTALYRARGVNPLRTWQAVASAVLGPSAFRGGWPSGLFGIVLHCLVAFGAATVFVFASRSFALLVRHPYMTGIAYGILVFVFMNMVVVPLSAKPKQPVNISVVAVQLAIHIVLIGIPISLTTRFFVH
jgi:hypothetical protein